MIYKNKDNKLWCECGNRTYLEGFAHYHKDKTKGTNCEGFCKMNNWYCLKCGKTINFDEAELKEAPENTKVGQKIIKHKIMSNQELSEKREKLSAFLGQLIDLESGHLDEIIIRGKSEHNELLKEVVLTAIENIETELKTV